ncbi:T9SS type B sorting domain-containing protein [Flagellimonas sp. CMM7]|uniref:T9SS type B sorting domain-containing protein n=1 Tax=Flagellimonas sp. CMM7 TaxID=2654676 RepID=UPI0013D21001|nr:T9SS type B sorting domain-containing protein [Flagellimonas sp. CMM7]UII81600.1 T9SS type B sorting domain-containing protein [Flagellimonas sp. CMM7]
MTNHFLKTVLCLIGIWFIGFKGQGQEVPFTPRLNDGGNTYLNIKGDYTFLSNSVMNRVLADGTGVNTPYNGSGSNNSLHIEYVDVDSDPTTYSSSSSTLSVPDCSQIYWAGLYWAGNYDEERKNQAGDFNNNFTVDNNHYDVTAVKLMVPGGSYVDLVADNNPDPVGEDDAIIVDGYNTLPNDPYVCYKNVTSLLQALPDPDGEYTVANVRGTRGSTNHGAAGWTLVVIYENPTLTGKYISVFDGYEGITTQSGNSTADITVSGFNTIPVGPVNARVGVSTLEGESSLDGDTFGIVSNSSSTFTDITNAANPDDNFFNSTITEDGVNVASRNINSTNAIGFDSDVFDLNNFGNSIIDNGDTSATLRLGTSRDWFASFLVTFGVEIIEPDIVLEKKVQDIGGVDITGQGVNLGQVLDYVLSFVNTGNDDGTAYTIRDVLPANVTLDETTITVPTGVTYTYDSSSREVIFTIPDNLIEEGDPISEIRMRVQVAQNCFDFVDACTDIIQNLAYSTYEGVINPNQISDDPSVSDFDDCGFTTPGATNFLLDDLSACSFTRPAELCGDTILLDAGDNFDSYTWYLDVDSSGTINAGDTIVIDLAPDGDPSTIVVDEPGTYIVDKEVADPCKDFIEIIEVSRFADGAALTNPITDLINDTTNTVEGEILICPNDGSELPEIFLCGLNDTELVQISILNSSSIVWEQLDEAASAAAAVACNAPNPVPAAPPSGCANTDPCTVWTNVGTGNDFLASDAGEYRVTVNYPDGCFRRFNFNVFKNPLDPQYTSSDIICATDGNITITNMPLDYEYRLIDQGTGNVLVGYNPDPSFTITNNGAYTVEMRQQGVTDGCVFILDNIGILDRDFQVDVETTDTNCNGLGEIEISILNVEAQYYYEISQGGTVVDTFGPSNDNNYTFENLNDGIYDIAISTDDGCSYTEQVTINDLTNLAATALTTKNIDCTDGVITVTGAGGFPNPDYAYAIWSYNGVDLYPSVGDIPGGAYQILNNFTFTNGEEGDYEFIVVDGNNCSFVSNSVSIAVSASVQYTTATTDEVCFGAEDGTISINITNSNGYDVRFRLLDDLGNTITNNNSGNFTGLAQGDYRVRIRQRPSGTTDNCFFFEDFTIGGQASGISGNATMIQDYTCLQDGIIEAQNVAGGTAPYEYSIDGVNFFKGVGAETFSNLTNGTFNITIRDANNCTFVTNGITFDPLNPPSDLTFTASTPNCPALTSDVTATVVDGNTPFVFEIVAPAPIAATSTTGGSADFDGLAPGTYTFRVTDDKGCTYDESFTINPVSQINVSGQLISNITCLGDTDGEVTFTVADFNTDYDYTVTGPANFNGSSQTAATIPLTGLADGTYTIVVTDNLTNCTATTDVTVNAPAAALTLSAAETQPTCPTDGSVILTSTGGWGGNTFALTNPDATPFGTNATGAFNGLTQTGTYSASVTDVNGCVVTTTFDLDPAIAPVLAIVPNDTCYDDAVGLTLTANVTSGGDGSFEYSLNGGAFGTGNVFAGLTPGTYSIDVRDGKNCTDSASITIDPELSVIASAPNITACAASTNVNITAAGGDNNYVYAIVADGVSPTVFSTTNPVSITGAGDYDVYVRDNAGNPGFCEVSFDLNIVQDAPLALSIVDTGIQCSGEAQATITITASGGEAPYQYSINNGTTYQPSNTFVNQPAGSFNIRVRDANNCDITEIYNITEPLTLSASAAVTQLAECNPGLGAEVRITNAIGGTAPYEYSFDGGTNYNANPIGFLLPGTHTLFIQDANNCTFPMTVTIDPEPTPPGVTAAIDYECDGEGIITITPDNAGYSYTYEIDATPNTPNTSNVFNNVLVGSHTITVNYTNNTPPSPSVLLLEDFGAGVNTPISEIDPAYCYEPQDGSASLCGFGTDTHIQDGEYSVTQLIVNPYGSWVSPNDHTGIANGRFLAINVGGVAGVGGVVYQKTSVEVIPNRDITVSLWAFNLQRSGTGGGDPSIEIQLVDGGGGIIASTTTGNVPKNNNANDWQNYSVSLNPGANTNLDIVIRTNSAVVSGNDIAIDDIQAIQIPEICAGTLTVDVEVEAGNAFGASITGFSDITCNAASDGTITFEVENFDAVNGFEYRLGGVGPYTTAFASPVIISGLGPATPHNIEVRDVLDNTCSIPLSQALSEPVVLATTASITDGISCINGGATITASVSGGTPAYEYQLEDGVGGVITAYQNSTVFSGLAAGDYIVRARDANGCEDPIDTALTVAPFIPITYTFTACYGGNNDGTIQIDVTAGNNDYEFSLDGGPWVTPTPATATTHTFTNLASGNYTINVRDGFGCTGTLENVTIHSAPTIDVVDISTCADGSITVTAPAALTNLEYAFVPTTTSPTGLFSATNTFAVTTGNDGDYDVYVRDTSAANAYCDFIETVTVNPATPLTVTNTPTDPLCHDGTGSIFVDITSGIGPYTIQIIDLDNAGASDQTDTNVLPSSRTYFNLMPGDYTINVTDATGCTASETPVTVANPDELTATIVGATPMNCTGLPSDFGFDFTAYPTTLGTIQFSADGGTTWVVNTTPGTTDEFRGYNSGDIVNPSMRIVDGSNNTVCQTDFPPFIIPYPLDDLDITILPIVVNCNELQVTVRGQNGTGPYEYAFSDDPANFNPATATWTAPLALGVTHTFLGLVPGRSYTFYVRDFIGCVRGSSVNVNDIITVPLDITSAITPSCDGASNGSITYTVTDTQAPFGPQFRWEVFDMTTGVPVSVANSGGNVAFSSPQNIPVPGLDAGNYFIEVVEVDGGGVDSCIGATENELLEELDPLTGTPAVLQDISCDTPGLIQVQSPFGGGGTYTYTVTGPAPFVTIVSTSDNPIEIPANSPAGNYHVTIEDQYGCSTPLGNVPLTLTPNPTIDAIAVDNCTNPSTVTITATSGAAQVLYSLDNGTTYADNGGIFNNVTAGTYNVAILDSNGCSATSTVTVHPVLEVDIALTKLLDCSGAPDDAQITIEVLAGSGDNLGFAGSYDYEITDGTGTVVAKTALLSNPFVFNTTTPENYTITVYDNNTSTPCTRVANIVVDPAITPSFNITSNTNITCNGDDDGTINVSAIDNGIGAYAFEIISGPGSSAAFPILPTTNSDATASFTGLEGTAAGITYTIEVTAANGCTTTLTQVITQPDPITNVVTEVVEFGCATGNNRDNATITVNTGTTPLPTGPIVGGSGTYVIYEFIEEDDPNTVPIEAPVVVQSGASNIFTETDPAGGVYTINVYDSNGCFATVNETINPFDELLSASAAIDAVATCVSGENITITATGSITNSTTTPANYEFRHLPAGAFQPSGSFTGLAIGMHNFEVRNTVTGCIITTSHEVVDPQVLDLIVVNTTNITCFGDTNGTVELNLQDAGAITYPSATNYTLYYDVNNTPTNLLDDVTSIGSDADGNFTISALAAGTYYIEVEDTNPPGSACTYTQSFNIAGPSVGISANTQVTDVTCALNDGIIEVINAAGGWSGYTYFVDLASNPAPTFPGSYQASPLFSGLAGGAGPGTDYQVWVADQNGCEFQLPNENLVDPIAITATLQINQDNCTALQGEIEVTGTAGGQGSNYTYQLVRNGSNVGSPQTNTVFSGLGAGSYEVLIADQWSCSSTIGPVILLDEMIATPSVVKPIDCTVDPGGHITITITGGSSNLTYDVVFPDAVTAQSNATGIFTGLTQPGTYSFTVTDNDTGAPCTVMVTQDLDDKVDPVISNVVVTPVSCNGGSDGALTVELDPATVVDPVYTYELYEISNLGTPYRFAQTSATFDNLPQGDYRVRVISARACDDFYDETVTEPSALIVSATATPFACNASNTVNTSTITASAAGGIGPYLYSIDNTNFQTSNTFDIIDNGAVQNITVYITDANSCSETAVVAPIEPINVFTANITLNNGGISCAGPEEVLITVTDNGNPANTYSYELLPVGNPLGSLTATPTNVTSIFDLTEPGSYTFRITDNTTGCYVDTAPYEILPYDLIEVVATPTAPAICFGDTNGALEINVTGYSGTYDYEVFNADGTTAGLTGSGNTSANPLTISGLGGGNYFVRVTETSNPLCIEDSNTITIVSPDMALTATPVEVANVTCTNDLGEIEVSPTGGFAPYDIQLTNTTTTQVYNVTDVVSFVFPDLSAGLFDVQITDDNGCIINEPITLVEPTPITADIDATLTNLVCYGDTNATVTAINVLNGEGVYQYVLNVYDPTGITITFSSGAQSSPDFNNLGAGIYSITVSDGWSCGIETVQVTISEPVEVMANLIQLTQLTCTAQAQIELSATGGTGPYEFSVDGSPGSYTTMAGGTTHTFSVPAGPYQYYVRDAFGCDAMISNQVTVDPVVPLDLIIDDNAAFVNCTGEASATIIATAIGGLGNYSYELFTDAGLTTSVAGPQNTGQFNTLMAGTYYVNVTSLDCDFTSGVINIIDPAPLQVDTLDSTDVTCAGLEDGTITVEVSGGTGDIFYAITPNLNQFDTENTFTDLAPGIYDVIAQDSNGCFETFQFEILQPEPVQVQAINVMHEVCFNSEDGSFELDITGGTAPYESSLNSNADADYVLDQVLFQNLPAGTHVVFVRDAQGCESNVFVEINPGVNLTATVTPIYECSGNLPTNRLEIVFEDPTVSGDVLYGLDTSDPAMMQLTPDFTNILAGDHTLTILHSNGCPNTIDFSITGFEPLTLLLENSNINEITAIAAGGLEDYTFFFGDIDNGTDNTFIINRTDTYPVTVIDQNGCEVVMEIFMEFIDIETPNFFTPDGDGLNDRWLPDNLEAFPNVLMIIFDRYGRELYRMGYGDSGWDGIYNNTDLPTGDYWYIIKLQGETDDREFIGHFTLYRQ